MKGNIIILGSGRSGTSMVAGGFAEAGFHMGDRVDYLKKSKANPKGFFEDYEVNTINEDILKKVVINLPEKIRRRFLPSHTFYRARWLARIPLCQKITSDIRIDERINDVMCKEPFCFKDPRFSYTLPVWQRQLTSTILFIVVFRHPHRTAQSTVRECQENPALRTLRMNEGLALKTWKCMYSHILKNYEKSEDKSNWLFVNYNQVFEEKWAEKIEAFSGVKINTAFAEKKISRTDGEEKISDKEISLIYGKLNHLSSYDKV